MIGYPSQWVSLVTTTLGILVHPAAACRDILSESADATSRRQYFKTVANLPNFTLFPRHGILGVYFCDVNHLERFLFHDSPFISTHYEDRLMAMSDTP